MTDEKPIDQVLERSDGSSEEGDQPVCEGQIIPARVHTLQALSVLKRVTIVMDL